MPTTSARFRLVTNQPPSASFSSVLIVQQIKDRHIKKVAALLLGNLTQPPRIAQLATNFKRSRRHLARLFKAETGYTPRHFLQCARLERACVLLADSDLSIKEICLEIGFAMDGANFDREFRKWQGETPTEYRRKMA